MIRGRAAAGLAFLLLGATPATALDPALPPALYQRQRWGAEEGFPGGAVHAIAQAGDGTLWMATERGVVRFDGAEFQPGTGADDAAAGAEAVVLGIVRDRSDSLWLRADGPELIRYRDGRREGVPFNREPREVAITAMTLTREGDLLFYAQLTGLLERQGERIERRRVDPLPPSVVLSMAETDDETLFLGTRDSGLFRLGRGALSPVAGLPDPKVNCLLAVGPRDLWVGTDGGVVRWNGQALTREGVPDVLHAGQVLALLRDRDANVWAGTAQGLVRVNANGSAVLAGERVTALFEDREGDLWVGNGSGVERVHEAAFAAFGRAQGLPADGGGAVHVDGDDRVWFAPADGGLFSVVGDRVLRVPIGGPEPDRVYSIASARDGLWLGRQRGGVTHLRRPGAGDGLPRSNVYAVHEARDGSVWAGTLNAGLVRRHDGRADTCTTANGLPSNSVNAIAESHDGTIWVGTPAGLASWSSGAWTTRRVRDGLPSDNVLALAEDSQGVLWVGTAEGLGFLRSGRVEAPRAAPPSLREPVVGMAESEGGWLWVATARRMMRVRRASVLDGSLVDLDVVSYGRPDGLVGGEGVRRHRSLAADRRGRVWLATSRGLFVVSPRRVLAAQPPPLVRVRALLADDQPVALGPGARVPPTPRRVRIAFGAVSLQAPDRVRYRYALDGFDSRWSEPVATGEAVYANLGPGAYRFRVQASGADGQWHGPEAAADFAIAPALWQAAWFRVAAALALALAGWRLYAWRLGRAERRLNAAFEERLAERTRIAQELHDTLLQGFISASMQLHVAAEQVPADAPARSLLTRVQQLMGQVIEEGRNTVRGLRTEERGEADLATALSGAGADLAGEAAAELRVIVEGAPEALHPAVHDALYRIGREAVANALRHARAGHIEVELEYAPRAVRLSVRDDGVGVDAEVLRAGREGHYGLSGMRERAEAIGGRLRLLSAPGAGTEVELTVRGSVAYASPARHGWGWLGFRGRGADAADVERGGR